MSGALHQENKIPLFFVITAEINAHTLTNFCSQHAYRNMRTDTPSKRGQFDNLLL